MMNFFGNCPNTSCDILTLVILLWLLTNVFGKKCGHGHGCGCGCGCDDRRDHNKCFNIDICTIVLLFVIFGGKMLKF